MKRYLPLLILFLFLAPMGSAWVVYKYYPDMLSGMSRSNHGEFVDPVRQVDAEGLVNVLGNPLDKDTFRDHWTMLYIGKPGCDESCRTSLDKMRQVRLTQGPEMSRVITVFVIVGAGDIGHLSEYLLTQQNMLVARLQEDSSEKWLKPYIQKDGKSPVDTRRVYFIDKLGQLMMYFELDGESKEMDKTTGMRKDLKKLLYDSKIG